MLMKKFLLGQEGSALSQSYIWYSLGGLLNAGQSALLLVVISRTNPSDDAGIYAIAYAIACLASTVGLFGVRNYQATDVLHKYSFSSYLKARIVSNLAMLLVIAFYLIKGYFYLGYSYEKCLAVLFLGLLKLVDAIEDVFHGRYQQSGRLDVAGRCVTIRYFIMLVSFMIGLVVTHNLVRASIISLIASLLFLSYSLTVTYRELKSSFLEENESKPFFGIYLECFSLFAGAFLALYIANVPKYAIDELCTEAEQASFNYIFMPVYVVNVLNTFIFQPLLNQMAKFYEQGEKKAFARLFWRQIGIIVLLVSCVLLAGYFLGIPVLGWLYNSDLTTYKTAFMILLVGSAFLATEGYMAAIITVFRKQKYLLIGYGISAILAIVVARKAVREYGVLGASVAYSGIIMVQMFVFIILFLIFYRKNVGGVQTNISSEL